MPLKDGRVRIVPVILAGGEGRRLRPLTAQNRPKPYLKIASSYNLLQATALRTADFNAPVILTHHAFSEVALESLIQISLKPQVLICEPANRGTAIALAVAAFALSAQKSIFMAVMPSDHYVENPDDLKAAILRACANVNALTLIGIKPLQASSRYGYIKVVGGNTVESFVEKPSIAEANDYISTGNYFWNTGMFVCRPEVFLSTLEACARDIYDCARDSFQKGEKRDIFFSPHAPSFFGASRLSVDYAVLEKNPQTMKFIELSCGWSDLGTWPAIASHYLRRRKRIFTSASEATSEKNAQSRV